MKKTAAARPTAVDANKNIFSALDLIPEDYLIIFIVYYI